MISMNKRILLTAGLFLCVVFLPYWVYVPAVLAALVLLPFYWEAVPLALVADVLYGGAHPAFDLGFPFAIMALLLVLVMIPARERLRLHA